ncbi:hypothetical protein P8452_44163 [Trifolium repens]|nr:hypothetical protein P8452_44163 [Trifolium repens]
MSSSVPLFHPVRVAIFLSAVDRLHDDRVEMVSNDVAVFVEKLKDIHLNPTTRRRCFFFLLFLCFLGDVSCVCRSW